MTPPSTAYQETAAIPLTGGRWVARGHICVWIPSPLPGAVAVVERERKRAQRRRARIEAAQARLAVAVADDGKYERKGRAA